MTKVSQIGRVNGSTEVVRFPRYLNGTEVGDNVVLGYAIGPCTEGECEGRWESRTPPPTAVTADTS